MNHSPKTGLFVLCILSLTVSLTCLIHGNASGAVISKELLDRMNLGGQSSQKIVWVFFSDKPSAADEPALTERSFERRKRQTVQTDMNDVQVNGEYTLQVANTGAILRSKSRWFNAVSCLASNAQIHQISLLPFVKSIESVSIYRRAEAVDLDFPGFTESDDPAGINYGPSFNQSSIISIPQAHDKGFTGQGVLIASFDSGFDNLSHNCFNRIRSKGIRTYDFVNGDTIVANGQGRLGNGAHGTLTLSLMAAYDPGSLVSPAFDSEYILAKTENTESETPLEEDNWVAAAEWADSLGADIISSSLGYLQYNPPYQSYTWQSMNGVTALISRAADIAVSRGIIVVTSAGNSGFNSAHNTLNAPGDAFNVITVGAVTSGRQRASFSSVGPTADGRIKPDVMALGVANYTARFGEGGAGYLNSNVGTSLSCPMVAGVCAMILSANRSLTPLQVKDILRNTASNSLSPNNQMGYGIVNAWSAVQLAFVTGPNNPEDYQLSQNYPNPFNPTTTFRFTLLRPANVSLLIYDSRGRLVDKVIDNTVFQAGVKDFQKDFSGSALSSGAYFYSLIVNGELIDTKKMLLVR